MHKSGVHTTFRGMAARIRLQPLRGWLAILIVAVAGFTAGCTGSTSSSNAGSGEPVRSTGATADSSNVTTLRTAMSVTTSSTPLTQPNSLGGATSKTSRSEASSTSQAVYSCQPVPNTGTSSDAGALTFGPVRFQSLQTRASVPKVAEAGLTVDDPRLSVFRLSPITIGPFDGIVTITLSTGLVYFAYPADDSWISGSGTSALDLTPFLSKTMKLEGCSDSGSMLLGGIVAQSGELCFEISASEGGKALGSARVRLDGQKCS